VPGTIGNSETGKDEEILSIIGENWRFLPEVGLRYLKHFLIPEAVMAAYFSDTSLYMLTPIRDS